MKQKMVIIKKKKRQSDSLVQNCIILYEWKIEGMKQEMKSKMSIDWGLKE